MTLDKLKVKNSKVGRPSILNKSDSRLLKQLYAEEGLTMMQIANRFGTTIPTISKYLKEFGIPKKSEVADYNNPSILRSLYIDKKMNASSIARKLNCEASTISTNLKKFKIEKRPMTEIQKELLQDEKHMEKIRKGRDKYWSERGREEHSKRMKEKWQNEEYRVGRIGENNPMYIDGRSFLPYCPKFNDTKREEIRNRDNRVCQMPGCGKSEILEGKRMNVHHIDADKMQGCEGKKWGLVALCSKCNLSSDTIEKEFLIVSNLNI